jgi:uracil-DNA glycosylase family 4
VPNYKHELKEPEANCQQCKRLAEFRSKNKVKEPNWHNGPVKSFGPLNAQLLVIGLAPGFKGANRTGRPFTGDFAGDLLYPTLRHVGLMSGEYGRSNDDMIKLHNCRITNAVRCVPPKNKPTTNEIRQCNTFLQSEIAAMASLKIVLALGHIAHNAVLRAFSIKLSTHLFQHGAVHPLTKHLSLANSYHCSRYNTNTGRLTEEMFHTVLIKICSIMDIPRSQ